ncbi:hypothetical protein ABPG72_022092, partial [Tetrahymena utriculariae]
YISYSKLIYCKNDEQLGNLSYQSPEVIDKKKPYTIATDVFTIGVILLEALLQRKLKGMEYLKLKTQNLMSVFPDIQNEQNHEFITEILSKMVEPNVSQRSQPLVLLQLLNKFRIDEKLLKLVKIKQNIEIQDIEHQNFSKQEQLVQKVQNKKKQVKQNKISDDEEEQEMYQNKQVKFDQIENENKQIKNTINQQIQPAIEISQSPQIIKGGKKTQYYTQIQQDIKQNKQTEITELPQIQITNNNSGEQKVTYMEIEQENNKKVKKSVDKKQKKNKNDKNKQLDQDINNEAQNCIIQVDIKQLILNQILMSQIKKNEIQIQKYNDCLRQNPQVQNDLKQLIQQLKQKKQYISKNQVDNFHIEDYQPFYENYEDEYDKEIKIIDIKNIPQQKNYGVVEIELKYISAIEEEILKLGEFLQKCQKMRFLTLNVEFSSHYHEGYEYSKRRDLCEDLLAKQLDQCFNLVSLNLDLNVHNEGEKYIGNFIGQCKNLCFLKLKLNVSNTLDSIFSDVVKRVPYISKRLSQCQNLVNLDLYLSNITKLDLFKIGKSFTKLENLNFLNFDLSLCQLAQGYLKFANYLQNCKSIITLQLHFRSADMSFQDLKHILISLESLQYMKFLKLDLSSNELNGIAYENELEGIRYKSLTDLTLDIPNNLSQQQLNKIIRSFKSCENLNSLHIDLRGNNFKRGSQANEICFYELKNLTHLSLISAKIFCLLFETDSIDMSFYKCKQLISLNLKISFFQINNEDLDYIGLNLQKCQNLNSLKLDLSECELGKVALDNFGISLSQCVKINSLDINFKANKIGQTHAQVIGQIITNLQNLIELKLNLSDSQIRQKGLNFISQGLEKCKNLSSLSLDLSNSMISVNALKQLAQSLKQNKKIKSFSLKINRNKLSIEAVSSITAILNDHLDIKNLSLSLSFSIVVEAQSKIDQNRVAIEILNNDQIQKINHKKLEKCKQILENFTDDKYFIQFVQSIEDLEYGNVAIVTQIYETNLALILENNNFTMSQIHALTYQLLKGVLLLQEKGIVIKEIQPQNILYSSSKNQFLLTYHRFSKFIESSKKEYQKRNLNYLSPQVIDKIKPYTTSLKVDEKQLKLLKKEIIIQCKEEEVKQEYQQLLETENLLETEQQNTKQENIQKKGQVKQEEQNLLQAYSQFVKDYKQANKLIDQDEGVSQTPQYEKQNLFKNTNLKSGFIKQNNLKQIELQEIDQHYNKEYSISQQKIKIKSKQSDDEIQANASQAKFLTSSNKKKEKLMDLQDSAKKLVSEFNMKPSMIEDQIDIQKNEKEIKIDKIKDINKAENYEIVNFDFRENWLDVEGLKYIGSSLERCQNIKNLELNFEKNNLGQQGFKDFALSLSKCINYEFLDINLRQIFFKIKQFIYQCMNSQNNIGINEAELIGQSISKLQNIKHFNLNLDSNKVGKEGIKSIAQGLETCINLTQLSLNLSKINMKLSSVNVLAYCLKKCTKIFDLSLNLSRNKLQNQAAKSIGVIFSQSLNLKKANLYLEGNSLDNIGLNDISVHFQNCQSLVSLNLSLKKNKLGFLGLEDFTLSLSKCINFQYLEINFSQNNIGGNGATFLGQRSDGAKSIALGQKACINLTQLVLILSKNNLTLNSLQLLASCLKKCTKIYDLNLDFSWNKLQNQAASCIGTIYSKLLNIKKASLHLEGNCFDKLGLDDISSHLQNCKSLVHLNTRRFISSYQAAQRQSLEGINSLADVIEEYHQTIMQKMKESKNAIELQSESETDKLQGENKDIISELDGDEFHGCNFQKSFEKAQKVINCLKIKMKNQNNHYTYAIFKGTKHDQVKYCFRQKLDYYMHFYCLNDDQILTLENQSFLIISIYISIFSLYQLGLRDQT